MFTARALAWFPSGVFYNQHLPLNVPNKLRCYFKHEYVQLNMCTQCSLNKKKNQSIFSKPPNVYFHLFEQDDFLQMFLYSKSNKMVSDAWNMALFGTNSLKNEWPPNLQPLYILIYNFAFLFFLMCRNILQKFVCIE